MSAWVAGRLSSSICASVLLFSSGLLSCFPSHPIRRITTEADPSKRVRLDLPERRQSKTQRWKSNATEACFEGLLSEAKATPKFPQRAVAVSTVSDGGVHPLPTAERLRGFARPLGRRRRKLLMGQNAGGLRPATTFVARNDLAVRCMCSPNFEPTMKNARNEPTLAAIHRSRPKSPDLSPDEIARNLWHSVEIWPKYVETRGNLSLAAWTNMFPGAFCSTIGNIRWHRSANRDLRNLPAGPTTEFAQSIQGWYLSKSP